MNMEYTKIYNSDINETIYCAEHKSGLGVFVIPKPGFTKKYAVIGTKFGSVNNTFVPLGENEAVTVPDGVAHFLEHKMFEQSDGTNAFDAFSKYGANANAYTSFTCTCYLFSCTEHFNESFEHLLSYVRDPYFTEENVSKEQGIIGQEIRMYDDEGSWQVAINMLKALYHNNPVRIDIAGTVESISEIDKDVLYKCYNSYYNPGNMAVTVCGDVDVDEVMAIVDRCFDTDVCGCQVESVFPEEPDSICQRYIETHCAVAIPMFSLGFKDNYRASGDELLRREMAINIIAKLICGKSSRLYTELYEKGLINEEFGFDIMVEEQFSCAAMCGESNDPKAVEKAISEEIANIRKNGFDEECLDRVKKAYLGSFYRGFNDVEQIAGTVERNVLSGVNIFNFATVHKSIDMDYINTVFDQVFNEDTMAMSIVWPAEEK